MNSPPFGWVYICSEAAEPIVKAIFGKGPMPGSLTTIPDEDFEILREGLMVVPVHIRDGSQIVKPRLVVPQAS